MKDDVKWWGVLFVSLLSVLFTTHMASRAQRLAREAIGKVDEISAKLDDVEALISENRAFSERASKDVRFTLEQLAEAIVVNKEMIERLVPDSGTQGRIEARPRETADSVVQRLRPEIDSEHMAMAIQAFEGRKQAYRKSLSPQQAETLEGLRDSTVELIFQTTELPGIENDDELEAYKDELRKSGELQQMYDGIEDALLTEMMLNAIGSGEFKVTADTERLEGRDDAQ